MWISNADRDERMDALHRRFHDGEFTETVYRASLFALGLRGEDLYLTWLQGCRRKPTCELH